jgi:hypothetical protein
MSVQFERPPRLKHSNNEKQQSTFCHFVNPRNSHTQAKVCAQCRAGRRCHSVGTTYANRINGPAMPKCTNAAPLAEVETRIGRYSYTATFGRLPLLDAEIA